MIIYHVVFLHIDQDLESEDLTIEFDFNAINTLREKFKANPAKSFENCALEHKKRKEILVEPLVAAYLNLKWQSLKGWWYGYRVLFFLAFGVCLTFMISFIVEMNSTCTYSTTDNIKISQYNSELVKKFHLISPYKQVMQWTITISAIYNSKWFFCLFWRSHFGHKSIL